MLLSPCSSPRIYRLEIKQRGCDTCCLQTSTISLCFPTHPIPCFSDKSFQGSPAGSPGGLRAASLLYVSVTLLLSERVPRCHLPAFLNSFMDSTSPASSPHEWNAAYIFGSKSSFNLEFFALYQFNIFCLLSAEYFLIFSADNAHIILAHISARYILISAIPLHAHYCAIPYNDMVEHVLQNLSGFLQKNPPLQGNLYDVGWGTISSQGLERKICEDRITHFFLLLCIHITTMYFLNLLVNWQGENWLCSEDLFQQNSWYSLI